MAQQTRVTKLDPGAAAALEKALQAVGGPAEWRRVAHARFSVKTPDVVATCYTSGKLVVQGADPDAWLARFVPGARLAAPKGAARPPAAAERAALDVPTIGSDETGKGDYFGPLVVAAAFVRPQDRDELIAAGITDSKSLTDARAETLAGWLADRLTVATVRLDPADYNRRYAEVGNLNDVLAAMHARAIGLVLERVEGVGRIVVDRFAREALVAGVLEPVLRGLDPRPELVQEPRGERHLPVAAASIVARAAFLEGLKDCADSAGTDLHKGAGSPVDRAAERVFAIGGLDLLGRVAKLHFKNTLRLR